MLAVSAKCCGQSPQSTRHARQRRALLAETANTTKRIRQTEFWTTKWYCQIFYELGIPIGFVGKIMKR